MAYRGVGEGGWDLQTTLEEKVSGKIVPQPCTAHSIIKVDRISFAGPKEHNYGPCSHEADLATGVRE